MQLVAYRERKLGGTVTGLGKKARQAQTLAALEIVGLRDPSKRLPRERSGGQKQGIAIARRLPISIAAVGAIMLVVLGSLALVRGLTQIADKTGNRNIAVLLREGATSEINSQIGLEQIQLFAAVPAMERAIVSSEVVVAINAQDKSSLQDVSLTFRGVDFGSAVAMRPGFKAIAGRQPNPGSNEIMVDLHAHDFFAGFGTGSERRMSDGTFRIVGIFKTDGSIAELEIWQSLFGKGSTMQSVRVSLPAADSFATLTEYNQREERLGLDLKNETEFLKSQAEGVTDRRQVISTLRTLGFSTAATFAGTIVESMTLALAGAILGIIASFALFQGLETSTVSGGFSKVVFDLSLGGDLVLQALAYAPPIGLLASMVPAWRAARRPILESR